MGRVGFTFTLTHLEHTNSVNHGAHSHILGTGRVHMHRHMRHADANLCVQTHIDANTAHPQGTYTQDIYTQGTLRYTVRCVLPGHTLLSLRYTLLRTYWDKDTFEHLIHLNTPMGHTCPTALCDTLMRNTLPVGLSGCPSLPSGHDRALAPSAGPLSVCSGSPFLYF